MEYKISKESVDKVQPTKFTGYVELTDADLLDAKSSLEDLIWEAHKTALHNGIRANTVMINKRLAKVNGFVHGFAGGFMDIPPMICGLEAYVTDEIPKEFAFGLVEAPETKKKKYIEEGRRLGYEEGYRQGVKALAERANRYYASLPTKTIPTVVEYTIKILAEELLEEGE